MLYSEKSNLAFVHIHKTGGLSFREFLERTFPDMREMPELPGPHHNVSDLLPALRRRGIEPETAKILTVIRNPFAHVVSIYHYWRSDLISEQESQLSYIQFARRATFPEFVLALIQHDPYLEALSIEGQIPPNVFVLTLEKLKDDAERVLKEQLGVNASIDIPHLNRTEHAPYMEFYDEELQRHIRTVYRWCFEAGYYE